MVKKHDSGMWLVNKNRFWVFIGQHWHVSGHSGGEQWCPGGVGCGKVLTGTIDEGTTSVCDMVINGHNDVSIRFNLSCFQDNLGYPHNPHVNGELSTIFFYSTIFSNTFMKQEIIFDMSCKSNCIMIIKDVQKCFYIYNPKDHWNKQRKEENCIFLLCETIFVRLVQPLCHSLP